MRISKALLREAGGSLARARSLAVRAAAVDRRRELMAAAHEYIDRRTPQAMWASVPACQRAAVGILRHCRPVTS